MIALLLLWHKIIRTHRIAYNELNCFFSVCRGNFVCGKKCWGRYCWFLSLFCSILNWKKPIDKWRGEKIYLCTQRERERRREQCQKIGNPFATPFRLMSRNVILHSEQTFRTRTKYYYWFFTDFSSPFLFFFSFFGFFFLFLCACVWAFVFCAK